MKVRLARISPTLNLPGTMWSAVMCSALAALSIPVAAQTTTPTPAQTTPTSETPNTIYKAIANTVVVDVVVTDASGRPVTGLTREQFHVQEGGEPQTVSFFEAHTRTIPQPIKLPPPLPPGEYTNVPIAPVTDSVNVLLLDGLNTPLQDQAQVRLAMVKYLKTAPPGTRMAIFTLASHLRFVQGFTADPALLLAAIDGRKKKATPQSSVLLTTPAEDAQEQEELDMMSDGHAIPAAIASIQQFQADEQAFRTDLRVRITLDAMQQIARYLAAVPGRKNLIWFSGSFPLNLFPDASLQDPFNASRSYSEDIHQTTDLLSIGQVAVYPVDARGLMTSPVFDVSVSGSHDARSPRNFQDDNNKFLNRLEDEHSTMDELARATGGQAIYNTNGLKEALTRVVDNGSNYYSVAYTPTNKALDGKLRKIEVKLDGKGYKLAYRRSYFADDVNGRHTTDAPATDRTFAAAMAPGLPTASQILFKVRALPLSTQPPAGPVLGDNAKMKGPTTRYAIDYAVSIHGLHFTVTPDGLHHGLIAMSIVAYDNEANPLNSSGRTLRLELSPQTFAKMLTSGLQAHAQIDLPKGMINLRTGIYDPVSTNMGIVDVPITVQPAATDKK